MKRLYNSSGRGGGGGFIDYNYAVEHLINVEVRRRGEMIEGLNDRGVNKSGLNNRGLNK